MYTARHTLSLTDSLTQQLPISCLRRRLWFGEAPASLPDLVRGDSVTVLRGTRLRQAYSRGDCHTHNTTASDL